MSENPTPELQMMIGSGGKMDYLVVGKKQGYLLGLKMAGVGPAPGGAATALALRIRSAKDPYYVPEDSEVVSFAEKQLNPSTVWDGINWDNKSHTRASVVMATIINGTPHQHSEVLLQGLKEAPDKIGNLMTQLCPEEYRVVSPETIKTWVEGQLGRVIERIQQLVQSTVKAAEIAENEAGVFQSQSSLLAKMYGQPEPTEPPPDEEDEEDEEDAGEDEEDDEDPSKK